MAKLKFIVEFSVDSSWVADGFNPTDEDAQSMIAHRLPHAHGSEVKGRILQPIDQEKAAKLQGYESVKAMHKDAEKQGLEIPRARKFIGSVVPIEVGG